MIRLFLNQGFKSTGLVPDFENIKRYLQSESVTFEVAEYEDLIDLRRKNLDQSMIRCDLDFGTEHVTQLAMAPEAVRFNRTFDSLTFESGHWLPRLKYFDLLRRKIVTHFGNVDIHETAGIICDSCSLEGLVSVAVSLGFRSIILFIPDGKSGMVDELSRYFIGVKIKTVAFSEITQNRDQTSLMINAVDVEKNTTLMNDLAYFNFMSVKGIMVDLVSKTPVHPLLFEAEKAGLRTLKRRDLAAFYDYESLRTIHPPLENTKNEFFLNYL
tara:strand:- start:33336 stop:34145 length:810 start_codon:yes stop_codon:yes gene_type:complete